MGSLFPGRLGLQCRHYTVIKFSNPRIRLGPVLRKKKRRWGGLEGGGDETLAYCILTGPWRPQAKTAILSAVCSFLPSLGKLLSLRGFKRLQAHGAEGVVKIKRIPTLLLRFDFTSVNVYFFYSQILRTFIIDYPVSPVKIEMCLSVSNFQV